MLGTDVAALDDVDKLVQAFESGDDQALMEALGQSTGGNRQVGSASHQYQLRCRGRRRHALDPW